MYTNVYRRFQLYPSGFEGFAAGAGCVTAKEDEITQPDDEVVYKDQSLVIQGPNLLARQRLSNLYLSIQSKVQAKSSKGGAR